MGIDARLIVYAKDQTTAEAAGAAAFARIGELDSIMSDYRKDSELMRLCAQAGGPPVRISPDLFKVLARSLEVSKRSDGAFDITANPIIGLWRRARREVRLPNEYDLRRALTFVGSRNLNLDRNTMTAKLGIAGMRMDLGGIAKGYACDEAQKVLKKHGITHALVEMGGDIVVSNAPPGTEGWTIRVPNAGDDKGPKDLQFANCAVSTSGDTEQFVVIDGVQYSHVVDPRTGRALTNRVQATVVAKDGLTSDPLSTALTVLEPSKRDDLVRRYRGVRVYVKEIRAP